MSNNKVLGNQIFQTIAEEAIMGILIFKWPGQKCFFANQLARETIEFDSSLSSEEITFSSLIPSAPKADMKNFNEDLLQHEGLSKDVLMQKTNETLFIADLGIKKIFFEKQTFFLLMLQDVTMQKKLQREVTAKQQEIHNAFEELLEQNKKLKELDLAKDRFMALTTHELRTPLSAIVATSDVLTMNLYDTDEQRDEFINTIHTQGNHLMNLINDILDFTKIQAGKMDFFIIEQNLNSTLDLTVGNFTQIAKNNEIILKYETSNSPTMCYFDELRLGEVLTNVIGNAVKFCRKNKSISVSTEEKEDYILVTVKDEGIGIKEENLDKIFNEFETIGNIKTHQKGTGLGMPISKRIMNEHGGKIWLTSEWEKGTSFFIEIPRIKVLDDNNKYRSRPDDVDDLLATV